MDDSFPLAPSWAEADPNPGRAGQRPAPSPGLELWGGFECSVTRVGESWRDQVRDTGHHDRIEDLDAVAALGIKTLRYPVLWERVSPSRPDAADWSWSDARLARLGALGIAPIAGLVHHGSGPGYTNLLDPAFPDLLAGHAAAAARRYPWIRSWTPVNEPLTTARFSGLYGHWYPHLEEEAACLRMLVNQCRGVLLSMRAIRGEIPGAELVQTDDLGRTFATPPLTERAALYNERRWLSFDLLAGRVDRSHPWWPRLEAAGVPAAHLDDFLAGDLGPFTIGINHYLTSDRYLDHRQPLYPAYLHGQNDGLFIDIEAVRIRLDSGELCGLEARLREAWERYRPMPLAITEVHLGAEVEDQVRWLLEAWEASARLKGEGVAMRAVTVWALIGSVDWASLLTKREGFYEPGAFSVEGGALAPTLLAEAASALARQASFDHPLRATPGWWRDEARYLELNL